LNHNINPIMVPIRDEMATKEDYTGFQKLTQTYYEILFIAFCKQGDIEKAIIMYNWIPKLDIHAYDSIAFKFSCINNHVDIVKWLHSIDPEIYLRTNYHTIFILCCENGNIDIVKWLYLYILNYDHVLFRGCIKACCNNHLKIACWLLDNNLRVKELVETCSYDEFNNVCVGKNFKGIAWLCKHITPDIRNQLIKYAIIIAEENGDALLVGILHELTC
jgi:hypothetical protein